MSIGNIDPRIRAYTNQIKIGETQKNDNIQGSTEKSSSFSDALKEAVAEVDKLQIQADKQMEGITLQKDGYTTHGAMIALEKADMAFQLMNNIRSKIVRAYEEVLRTQV